MSLISSQPGLKENTRAIAAMLLSMAGFILNDTLVKLVSGDLPLGQIILVRGLFATLFIFVVCLATGVLSSFRYLFKRSVGVRALAEMTATVLYLTALFNMPIANATAILQALPLAVTAGAALVFGDRVGWRRWLAILIGFVGVLLIVRPGLEGFDSWALVALAGMVCMALRDLATRKMPVETPTFGVALITSIGVTALGGVLSTGTGWEPLTSTHIIILAGAAGFILVGYVFIIAAMRSGDISTVAPFRYSIIIWAILIGFFVWGEVPDAMTLVGTAVIVSTGLYTLWRQRQLNRGT